MMTYPKINTLWKRDARTHKIIEGDFSCLEFQSIKNWHVTEKVDGTNIRVIFTRKIGVVNIKFAGKTDDAQIPKGLLEHLEKKFVENLDNVDMVFPNTSEVILFGEGYGADIQGGKKYRPDYSFVLFDVWVDGYWLEQKNVKDIAQKLFIGYVPVLFDGDASLGDIHTQIKYYSTGSLFSHSSLCGQNQTIAEGIVARSNPLMLFRKDKTPIMFKLKVKDYAKEESHN